mgnify:FL=1
MENIINQFVIHRSGSQVIKPDGWKEQQIGKFKIWIAPELPFYKSEVGSVRYMMLGLAFHISDSLMDEKDILNQFPEESDTFLRAVDFLCGNFIIIREIEEKISMTNDAGAAMKIFYHID